MASKKPRIGRDPRPKGSRKKAWRDLSPTYRKRIAHAFTHAEGKISLQKARGKPVKEHVVRERRYTVEHGLSHKQEQQVLEMLWTYKNRYLRGEPASVVDEFLNKHRHRGFGFFLNWQRTQKSMEKYRRKARDRGRPEGAGPLLGTIQDGKLVRAVASPVYTGAEPGGRYYGPRDVEGSGYDTSEDEEDLEEFWQNYDEDGLDIIDAIWLYYNPT